MDENYILEMLDDRKQAMKNNMTLNEIYDAISNMHNSIYNLRKNNEVTFNTFEEISKVCKEMELIVRYAIFNESSIDKFFPEGRQ